MPLGKKQQLKKGRWYFKRERDLETKAMKRISNLYEKIYSIENLMLADSKARKGKSGQYGVIAHDKNREENILKLHEMLKNKTYKTSEYTTFPIYEPKERLVYKLPFFPDRITHHAVMNILEPIFVSCFTSDTYSCIKGKGVHAFARGIEKALKDKERTKYCLKLDVTKFYPSVDHAILKQLLRRKFKDQDLLWLLDEIIDSADGLPIGNYLSQYFANFYLTYFDHWIKENLRVLNYFRYADDIAIFAGSKNDLWQILSEIREYFAKRLNLKIKPNFQRFPIALNKYTPGGRGLDVGGYVFYRECIYLRKTIKQRYARMMRKRRNRLSEASYYGWAKHCNSRNLIKKLAA